MIYIQKNGLCLIDAHLFTTDSRRKKLHCYIAKIVLITITGEKFPLWLPAQEDETDGLWHLDLSKFLKDGRIEWQSVKTLVRT